MQTLESRIALIEQKLSGYPTRLDVLEAHVSAIQTLNQSIDDIQSACGHYQSQISALENYISSEKDSYSSTQVRDELTLLHERIKILESSHESNTSISICSETLNEQAVNNYDIFLEHLFTAIFKHDASALKQAIHKVNNAFLSEHTLGDEQQDAIYKFAQWLKNLLGALEELLSVSNSSPNLTDLIQTTHHKIVTLLTECTDYEQSLQSKQIELHIPPFALSSDISQEWFSCISRELRKLLRKIFDPIGYFTASGDRLVSGDLIAVIDMCDGIMHNASLQEHTSALIAVATLQDISPQTGTHFDPVNHQVVGSCDGAPQDTIVEVKRRGFRYKERPLRKASVVIGR